MPPNSNVSFEETCNKYNLPNMIFSGEVCIVCFTKKLLLLRRAKKYAAHSKAYRTRLHAYWEDRSQYVLYTAKAEGTACGHKF